jgi:hypothetical protein
MVLELSAKRQSFVACRLIQGVYPASKLSYITIKIMQEITSELPQNPKCGPHNPLQHL